MTDPELFFTVHRDLPREGPGEPADVHWALQAAGVSGAVSVADLACGPGADLVTLADALPEARITGIDKQAHFVDAARTASAAFADRVSIQQGDMAEPGGPYDFIWCAGALYFLGVTEGLSAWRSALKPGGAVAFSEPVLLDGPNPPEAIAFWEADYPRITDLQGIEKRVKDAGYRVVEKRFIIGQPWANYYGPMKQRLAALRAGAPSAELLPVLDIHDLEIAQWEAARDHIAYALLVVRPE